ncbi:MAG TPA: DUF4388 domain-containing protein [Thermoanaerobaculia bacterium]|nr:DUF4388 domain-containing protein [Thermoanaerobaculia bacterium]
MNLLPFYVFVVSCDTGKAASSRIVETRTLTQPETLGTRALEGDLAMLPLAELLQFLHINGRDGVLVVSDLAGKPRAVLHYLRTQIVHATCDGIAGSEAVYAAMVYESGRFEFYAGTPERPVITIRESVQNLILEGLRRLDELSHLTSLLPGDDQALYVAPEPPNDEIRLTAREWAFLSLVNGKRTVRQIIEASGREEGEARAALIGLLTADLIVDRRDDAWLDRIVPRMLRHAEAGETRYPPPTLLANLLLKSCDGKKTLRELIASLGEEREILEELRLLVRTRWVSFARGEEEFRKWIEA